MTTPHKIAFLSALFISAALLIASTCYLLWFMYDTSRSTERTLANASSVIKDSAGQDRIYPSYSEERKLYTDIMAMQLAAAGLTFNSCGLMIGLSFAFLSLALFLFGIEGEFTLSATAPTYKLILDRISPGGLALLCALVVIVTCLTNRPSLSVAPERTSVQTGMPT